MEAPGPAVEKKERFLPLGARGGFREICLLILKGWGESNMAQMVIE